MNANDIQGFHIEPTNMCTLKCPGCARTQFIKQWPQHWKNHNLDIEHLLKFLDIDYSNKQFVLCGNSGDPIYHPDFLNFVKELKRKKAQIRIITNGSYKSENWWINLVELLDHSDTVCFSIDGVPDNFHKYRINGDWKSIELGLNVVGNAKIQSEWKYIPFNFNTDSIPQAKELATKYQIEKFYVEPSDRYDQYTESYKPTDSSFIGYKEPTKNIIVSDAKNNVLVDPACLNKQNHHYISANGYYTPCCYVSDYRFYYKTLFGKNKNQYKIINNTITELLKQPEVLQFYANLQNTLVCRYNCPKT